MIALIAPSPFDCTSWRRSMPTMMHVRNASPHHCDTRVANLRYCFIPETMMTPQYKGKVATNRDTLNFPLWSTITFDGMGLKAFQGHFWKAHSIPQYASPLKNLHDLSRNYKKIGNSGKLQIWLLLCWLGTKPRTTDGSLRWKSATHSAGSKWSFGLRISRLEKNVLGSLHYMLSVAEKIGLYVSSVWKTIAIPLVLLVSLKIHPDWGEKS